MARLLIVVALLVGACAAETSDDGERNPDGGIVGGAVQGEPEPEPEERDAGVMHMRPDGAVCVADSFEDVCVNK
jgi:hypothetical protein